VPTAGLLPAKVAVVPQTLCVAPAEDTSGVPLLVITTVLTEGGQEPLTIVHVKVVAPTGKLLATALGKVALLKVTAPLLAVQVPVPTAGTLPANV
jgi:hypothetical protein